MISTSPQHSNPTINVLSLRFNTFVLTTTLLFLAIIFQSFSHAQVSQAQIEQFKKLPPAQQAMLAKQMGVDVNSLKNQIANNSKKSSVGNTEVLPRNLNNNAPGLVDKLQENNVNVSGDLMAFGYDVFANSPQTFAPMMDIAIPANYIIGPGDVISVQIFGKERQELELPVNREGKIVFPDHGPVNVTGLTYSEVKHLLATKIKEKIIGVDVVIGIASLRSMRVFVLGEAHKPGPYVLSSLSSITHAIFAAGGVSNIGSLRSIQLKRAGRLVSTLDLYDLLINGDSQGDVLLQSGDVIFIPPKGDTISIEGEVRRPAIYELQPNTNFKNVVTMAGGLLPSAFAKTTRVERYNQNALKHVLNLDLSNGSDLIKTVKSGDVIHIMKAAESFEQSITIIGAVNRPGKYQWQPEQRVSDLFPSIDAHLLPSADINYGLIVREIGHGRDIEVYQFNLEKALGTNDGDNNLLIKENDKIIVFSNKNRLVDDGVDLNDLAFTKESLIKKEQVSAKNKYKEKQFWLKYGVNQKTQNTTLESTKYNQDVSDSLTSLQNDEKNTVNFKELTLFSRQRLLLPIIDKLKQQASSGRPLLLVEADGEVKFPGVYPLVKNASLNDLIIAAGGLTESAYLAQAEVTGNIVVNDMAQVSSKYVDLVDVLNNQKNEDFLLSPKERLNVHRIPAWSENNIVELRGEFLFPGKYTVRRGESLADLIEKAGGFTPFAYEQASVFTRVQLRELERKNLSKLTADLRVEMASKSMSDNNYTQDYAEMQQMLADMAKVEPVGRLVLDLPKVIANNDYDVALENGDILYVPTKKNAINIIGQVQVTSSHMFDSSLSADDYLAQSGGSKKRADEERIYIISANGSIRMLNQDNWFTSDADKLQPGDTIVVPLDAEYMNDLALWSSVTTIVYNTAVAIAAISGI